MPPSPEEIENARFATKLFGYDRDEVDVFLAEIAADYSNAIQEIDASKRIAGNPDLMLGDEVGKLLQQARETAESIRRQAQQEAEGLRAQAEQESMQRREEARQEVERLILGAQDRVRSLQEAEARLREQIKLAVESAAHVLDQTDAQRRTEIDLSEDAPQAEAASPGA
jgi:cell division initiation protein